MPAVLDKIEAFHEGQLQLLARSRISVGSARRLYETRTFFPLNQYLRKQIRARSFYGIPVYVDGEPWGAIVIDSSLPSIAKGRVVKVTSYYLPILDRLLKNF